MLDLPILAVLHEQVHLRLVEVIDELEDLDDIIISRSVLPPTVDPLPDVDLLDNGLQVARQPAQPSLTVHHLDGAIAQDLPVEDLQRKELSAWALLLLRAALEDGLPDDRFGAFVDLAEAAGANLLQDCDFAAKQSLLSAIRPVDCLGFGGIANAETARAFDGRLRRQADLCDRHVEVVT